MNNALLSCKHVVKSYGEVKAVCNVDMHIDKGEIVALLGSNGAGKTSLINLLLGRLKADSGIISINGNAPGTLASRQAIGAILQSTQLPDTLTVAEHICLFSSYYPQPFAIEDTLEVAQLNELANRRFNTLSGGQKQRVFFALAICGRPKIIFLDEPTVGLDTQSRKEFWACMKELAAHGTSILLTTHYLEEADALADRIYVMNAGKIIQHGTPTSLKSTTGGKTIRFTSDKDTTEFAAVIGITHACKTKSHIELKTNNAEQSLRELLLDETISDITVHQSTLEEAFVHLVSKEDPDSKEPLFDNNKTPTNIQQGEQA